MVKEGTKLDADKPRYDLVPWAQFDYVVKVLTFGAQKYDAYNWQSVKHGYTRFMAAAFRHLVARMKGEVLDQETGLPHIAHAICSLLFAFWFDFERKDDPD